MLQSCSVESSVSNMNFVSVDGGESRSELVPTCRLDLVQIEPQYLYRKTTQGVKRELERGVRN